MNSYILSRMQVRTFTRIQCNHFLKEFYEWSHYFVLEHHYEDKRKTYFFVLVPIFVIESTLNFKHAENYIYMKISTIAKRNLIFENYLFISKFFNGVTSLVQKCYWGKIICSILTYLYILTLGLWRKWVPRKLNCLPSWSLSVQTETKAYLIC